MTGRLSFPVATAATFLALFFAGCLDEAPPTEVVDPELLPHAHDDMPGTSFAMSAKNCEEGGFVAVYPMSEGASHYDTWYLADIREEVGNPMRSGLGTPLTGPADGNWHQGYRCESAVVGDHVEKDYIFGYVANMIEPPAFDPGGADLHFIMAGYGWGNGTIADTLRGTTTADLTQAYVAKVDWYVPRDTPRSAAYVEYSDVQKGQYLSYSTLHKYRDFPERTIRLWWGVPADGSQSHMGHDHGAAMPEGTKWHPVFWDIHTTGGEQYTTPPVDSPEVACHRGIPDHGPQGGLCQPTLTIVYEHKSVEVSSGWVIEDVVLDRLWTH